MTGFDSSWWDRTRLPCPVPPGTRIRLVGMGEDPCPIEAGTEGTVTGGNGGQVWVDWDNGRSLILCLPIDRYEVIGSDSEGGGQ